MLSKGAAGAREAWGEGGGPKGDPPATQLHSATQEEILQHARNSWDKLRALPSQVRLTRISYAEIFEVVMGLLIVLNAVVMAIEVQYQGDKTYTYKYTIQMIYSIL